MLRNPSLLIIPQIGYSYLFHCLPFNPLSLFYHCLMIVAYLDYMVRQYGNWPMRRLASVESQVCEIT